MSLPALVGTLARLLTLGTTVDRLTTFYNVEPGLLQPSPTISASKVRFPESQKHLFVRSTVHSLILEPATVAAILPRATLPHNPDMATTKARLYVSTPSFDLRDRLVRLLVDRRANENVSGSDAIPASSAAASYCKEAEGWWWLSRCSVRSPPILLRRHRVRLKWSNVLSC